jgi:hypothetical protein
MSTPPRKVTLEALQRGIELQTDAVHTLVLELPRLELRLPIDPRVAEHWDERFILTVVQGGSAKRIVKGVRDDHVPGDAYVDLVYDELIPGARYTLTVDPGKEGAPYHVFEDLAHDELFA